MIAFIRIRSVKLTTESSLEREKPFRKASSYKLVMDARTRGLRCEQAHRGGQTQGMIRSLGVQGDSPGCERKLWRRLIVNRPSPWGRGRRPFGRPGGICGDGSGDWGGGAPMPVWSPCGCIAGSALCNAPSEPM